MARAPFQVLVLPWRSTAGRGPEFAVLRRADGDGTVWQALSGGGEDDETPEAAARREMSEEAAIDPGSPLSALTSRAEIPTLSWKGRQAWADHLDVIPEYAFAVEVSQGAEIRLSDEHAEMRWLGFEAASALLTYESNRAALAELRDHLVKADGS